MLRFYISEITRFLRIHVTVCPPLKNLCYCFFIFFEVFYVYFFRHFIPGQEACLLSLSLKEFNERISHTVIFLLII